MSEKREFTANARVRVTVEVHNLGPYGADWKAGDIHDQVAREAVQKTIVTDAETIEAARACNSTSLKRRHRGSSAGQGIPEVPGMPPALRV